MKKGILISVFIFVSFFGLLSLPLISKGQSDEWEDCEEGSYWDVDQGKCVDPYEECPEGTYWSVDQQSCVDENAYTPTPNGGGSAGSTNCENGFENVGGVCFPTNTGLAETPVLNIITNVLNWLLGIFGFLAIIGFVISGIQYILSAGDERSLDTAKRNMKWSIVGVAVALSGLVIVFAVNNVLKANSII